MLILELFCIKSLNFSNLLNFKIGKFKDIFKTEASLHSSNKNVGMLESLYRFEHFTIVLSQFGILKQMLESVSTLLSIPVSPYTHSKHVYLVFSKSNS